MALRRRLPQLCSRALACSSSAASVTGTVGPLGGSLVLKTTNDALNGVGGQRSLSSLGRGYERDGMKEMFHVEDRNDKMVMVGRATVGRDGSSRRFSASAGLPDHTELKMPALSPTMERGNIVGWKKKEGDEVQPGDVYCEVETDKATIDWECQEEGFLARILAPDGTKDVAVGTPVAIIVEEAESIAEFKNYTPDSTADPAAQASESAPTPKSSGSESASAKSFPEHDVMAMPALSPTMEQGNILSWKKKEGDEVQPGDVYAEVETDKATIDWECQEEGIIAKFLVPEGTSGIRVGDPVLVLVDNADSVSQFKDFTIQDAGGKPQEAKSPKSEKPKPAAAPEKTPQKQATPSQMPTQTKEVRRSPGDRIIASPYAKKIASEANVSLQGAAGSGPGGRIVAADVQELIKSGGAATKTESRAADIFSPYIDSETSQIRRVIASRLLESKQQVPHYYLTISCRIDQLMMIRKKLNERLASSPEGGKLSVNDFVIAAAARAAKAVPEANSAWHGDFIRQYNNVDCSVAVQTDKGLLTPIIRNADRKGLADISAEVKELAARAKAGKLQPEEFTGGTITVSNLGMFGVTQFSAIINPPQASILAIGAAEDRVVPSKNGGFETGKFMTVTR